jgi:hypothetical protein
MAEKIEVVIQKRDADGNITHQMGIDFTGASDAELEKGVQNVHFVLHRALVEASKPLIIVP